MRNSSRLFTTLWLLAFLALAPGFSQDSSGSLQEERRQVLKYGIETDLTELIKALVAEKNSQFTPELVQLFHSTKSATIQEAILGLFLNLKDPALEKDVIPVLQNPDGKANSFLLSCVSYLVEFKSEASKSVFTSLTNNKNKTLALASIRSLGRLQALDQADSLIKMFQDAETDPNFRPDIIWSLGEMKAASAVDPLLKEYDEATSEPLLRQSILEALGKIGDEKAWSIIEKALQEGNAGIRAAAVGTLSSFSGKSGIEDDLMTALRDAQPGVRLAAVSVASKLKMSSLKDILLFKIKKDPDSKVKIESLKAVAEMDGGAAAILELLKDRKSDPGLWRAALTVALDKKISGTKDVLHSIVEAENKEKSDTFSGQVAGSLLSKKDDEYKELYGVLLLSTKAETRSLALRAISAGNYRDYAEAIKKIATKDDDGSVKALASSVLKGWGVTP